MFSGAEDEKVMGLAELAGMIEGVISENFGRGYWVKAELARLNLYPESGHCYPDLVEKEGKTIKAQMRGTIWAGTYQRISRQFMEVAREPLRDGLQILFFASVRFHPQYGLSLQINDIDPSFTLGQLARERMETIRRLKEEGVFDQNRQLPLPLLPKKIAVISVRTSKGYSDFMNILESYSPRFRFQLSLYPSLLQGEKAVDSILGQLRAIRKTGDYFDAVAIIRGGGGDVGLSCYDDYRLAREVATFPLPVISGIGHSTNETVVEMVSALNRITPTDVAYTLVGMFQEFSEKLDEMRTIIINFSKEMMEENNAQIRDLAARLLTETGSQMASERQRLDAMVKDTLQQTRLLLGGEKKRLATSEAILRMGPKNIFEGEKNAAINRMKWLSTAISSFVLREKNQLSRSEERVRLLDPVNILKRGYSITYHDGKPLKDASQVDKGGIITTHLLKGIIQSEVISKEEK